MSHGWSLLDLLPGLYVLLLGALLAAALRRWYDPVPRHVLACAGVLLLVLFGPCLFGGRILLPLANLVAFPPFHMDGPPPAGNYLQRDLVHQITPWLLEVRRAVFQGRWPLWNPSGGAGMPLLADPQSQAFQPLVAAAWPFPLVQAAAVTGSLRVLLGLVFPFLFLRRQGLGDGAALCGGLAYGLGGFLLHFLGWPLGNIGALLPAALYAVARCDEPGQPRDFLLLFLAAAALMLGGHPETLIYALAAVGLFLLARSLGRGGLGLRGGKPRRGAGIKPGVSTPGQRAISISSPEGAPECAAGCQPREGGGAACVPSGLGESGGPSPGVETPGFMPAPPAGALPLTPPRAVEPVQRGERSGLALLSRAGLTLLLAALAVAPFLLLAREYLPQSYRAHVVGAVLRPLPPGEVWRDLRRPESLEAWRERSLDRLLPVAAPRAFGGYAGYWGGVNLLADGAGFAGTAAALAALAALLPFGARRRFPQERLATGLLLAVLALQAQPPGFANLFLQLPLVGLTATHQHHRALLLVNLALAWLAACEVERWQRGEGRRPAVLLAAVSLAGVIVWAYLANPSPQGRILFCDLGVQGAALALAAGLLLPRPAPRWAAWVFAAVLAGELLWMHLPSNPPMPARLAFPTPPPVRFLQESAGGFRIAGLGNTFLANIPAMYGLRDVRLDNPATPVAYVLLTEPVTQDLLTQRFVRPGHALYDLLGARWVLTRPGVRLSYRLAFRHPAGWVYERPRALPLLFLPARARMHRGGPWTSWVHRNTDFAARALVQPSPERYKPWRARQPGASRVEVSSFEPARVRARASLTELRLLATSIYQDGSWHLLAGGERRPTVLANGPLAAAWLPAGEHEVELIYRPRALLAGCLLSALALTAAAVWWAPRPRFSG